MFTYQINLAERNSGPGAPFRHFAIADLGQCGEPRARAIFDEFTSRFPYPEWHIALYQSPTPSRYQLDESGPLRQASKDTL